MAGTTEIFHGEIVSIGTEILIGNITDTNASFIATRLPALGIGNYFISAVGDNMTRCADVLRRALGRSDIIFTTGGLGPTEDDLTREAIAEVLGETMEVEPQLEKELRTWFAGRGFPMPERNIKQATLIRSARAIPNPMGTAPGWWTEKDGKTIISMPGVPREMFRMFQVEVAPRLKEKLATRRAYIASRTIKTFGMSEAGLDERLGGLLHSQNPTIGVYARPDGIQARISALGRDEKEARALIAPMEEKAIALLNPHIWGYDDDTLEEIVRRLFTERGMTLATMESCTGGLLGDTLTNVPGSSKYYKGGFISYSTEMKIAWGVPAEVVEKHGVISGECAVAMAQAARERLGASMGVGITGVAGPDSQEGKPVGTVFIGIADAQGAKARETSWRQSRLDIKSRAVVVALVDLREWVLSRYPR